jgi:hypothetical protein
VDTTVRLRILQVLAAILIAIPGVLAIWLHAIRFSRDANDEQALDEDETDAKRRHLDVTSFLADRRALLQSGSILGAAVGLVTLASGALRNALDAADKPSFSATMVLVYGAGFTAMLALVYVPAYLSMQAAGRRLLEASAPLQLPDSPTFDANQKTRGAFEELLQLKVGPRDSFKIATAVLAPIVTGVVSVIIGVTI